MTGQGTLEATVAELHTAPGAGALAIICVCGPDATSIVDRLFVARDSRGDWKDGEIRYGTVRDDLGVIDDAMAVQTKVGSSFAVEVHTHGSPRVVERVLTKLFEFGARPSVESDGPSSGCWLREDRLEVDLWRTLARCRTMDGIRFAISASAALRGWLGTIPDPVDESGRDRLSNTCRLMLERYDRNRVLFEGIRVALIGPPNAGKSTLANRLFGHQAAVTHAAAGTTRDWVEEPASLAGVPMVLVDTAGLRAPADDLEEESIRRGLRRSHGANQRWFLADVHSPLSPENLACLERARGKGEWILVLNKIDLVASGAGPVVPPGWEGRTVRISARTGEGLTQLGRVMVDRLGLSPITDRVPNVICQRQAESLRSILADWESGHRFGGNRLRAELQGTMGIQSQ